MVYTIIDELIRNASNQYHTHIYIMSNVNRLWRRQRKNNNTQERI